MAWRSSDLSTMSGDKPTHDRTGVHRYLYEVDSAGRTLARRSLDEQAKRRRRPQRRAHLLRHAYDDAGNVIRTEWYGLDDRPVRMAEENAAAISIIRDEHGAEIERRLFDETGNLTLGAFHYAIQRIVVDARGLPVEWTTFRCRWRSHPADRGPFQAQGAAQCPRQHRLAGVFRH